MSMKRLFPFAIAVGLALSQSAQANEPCAPRDAAQRHPVLHGEPNGAALPPAQKVNGVRYMTGGIGVDSAAAMRKVRSQYALAVTFLFFECGADEFMADVAVRIDEEEGLMVAQLHSDGPYLYVDLPPGTYRLTASAAVGEPKLHHFRIFQDKPEDLIIRWVGTEQ
jgi:hypothetical protein